MNTSTTRQECATISLCTTSRTTDTAPMLSFAGCQNSTALTSLHCSIRSKVEVNFVYVCGFDTRRGSPDLQQVRLPVRVSRRRLRFSLRTHTSVLLYSDTIRYPSDNSIRLGRTDASSKIPAQRMQRVAEFNGSSYESYCSLEQLVASLSTADERKSAACTYHRVCIIRRQKATTPEDTCTSHPVCCIVGSALGLE